MLFVEKFSINIFLRFYSFMKKDSSPESNFFFFKQSLTRGSEAKKQTHPRTAGKLLGVKFYWEKAHQEGKLCGTQRTRAADAGDKHLSWVSSPVALQMVLNTSHRYAWSSSSLSDWNPRTRICMQHPRLPWRCWSYHSVGWISEAARPSLTGRDRKAFGVKTHTRVSKTQSPSKSSYYTFMCLQYGKH